MVEDETPPWSGRVPSDSEELLKLPSTRMGKDKDLWLHQLPLNRKSNYKS